MDWCGALMCFGPEEAATYAGISQKQGG